MIKKFFSAIMLVFAFLFLNLGFNSFETKAADELPSEIFANAGWGEKKNYWAIINYGADYIGSSQITIDIQQEAIADESVNSIAIVESGYSLSDLVHYERNVSPEFASKITYTLKNTDYGEKYITILLLTEFVYNPSEALIVDKITIGVNQKRTIAELTPEEILIVPSAEGESLAPYNMNVTLPPEIEGKGKLEDYVFKSVTYTLLGSGNEASLNALYQSLNNYYFTVYQNGTYQIVIEDIFGYKVTKEITINNLKDPDIYIEVYPSVTGPINHDYEIDVKVKFYGTDYVLKSENLSVLEVTFGGSVTSIKESMQIIARENGVYTIYARSLNGSEAELVFQVENIDKEAPFVQVLEDMSVYTESVSLFNPNSEVFVYDNVSPLEKITITTRYYAASKSEEGTNILGVELFDEYKSYLYTVRDVVVRYKVTDEAGNSVELDSYVKSIDDTIPVIERTESRKDFYINDPYPTAEEIEAAYGIIVRDNSLYEGSTKEIEYYLDFSRLPVDSNYRLNKLGLYNIFIRAIDEAGNVSESVSLIAEVRQRLITIEADADQYVIYGDIKAEDIVITYHCVTRGGVNVPCSEELLKGDSISGELYVLNATYVGTYEIHYDNVRVPSDLYYLAYGDVDTFTVKPRTIKVISHDKEKYYLDPDPELTYEIDMRVCDENSEYYNKDYRCTFAPNTGDKLVGDITRYMGEPPAGIEIWMDEGSWSPSEAVWYDGDGNLVAREILVGSLQVYEQYNGGVDNYYLDFEGAAFLIKPKHISVYIKSASKIYGEDDMEFEIKECRGAYPIDGATTDFCKNELRVEIYRVVEGETVKMSAEGQYIDYYEISGIARNVNYIVEFYNAYLTILKRDISISIVGDLDADGNPTGKYTIYYEDDIPYVELYDSSVGENTGLVDNPNLEIKDKFSEGGTALYTPDGTLITDYVNGIGIYVIEKGSMKILDKDNNDAEYNYNITFNPGQLEVIKKQIWIKIIKELSKIYGDEDKIFTTSDLDGYDDYVILEANGRYIIEIRPTTIEGKEDSYIPRDNEKMKYHLIRREGIYVGLYPISIEKLEGCENYDVFLFENYQYEIVQRDLNVAIDNQTIIYREVPKEFTYTEGMIIDGVFTSTLQYDDYLEGAPEVGEFRHVGTYQIKIGEIKIYDIEGKDVTENYNVTTSGGILKIVQREVTIDVSEGQGKQYGETDPVLEFTVYYNGQKEDMPEDDYKGALGREAGEEPDKYYAINWGTFEIVLNGLNDDGVPVGNYLIKEFNNHHKFFIEKRTIVVKARDVTAIYGNEYEQDIVYDTNGGLAYNMTLYIDGYPIYDVLDGNLKIIGTVDGVGTYEISCENIKILRRYTSEDVTYKYYNFSYENGTLTILPRTIRISPTDGQFKKYGDNDTGITYTYTPELLDVGDKFVGELKRISRIVNGVSVSEDVGEYLIGLGTLAVSTPSGKENYELVLDGSKTFTINPRALTVIADHYEIYYGDPFELTYTIEGDGLANNPTLGIVDTIEGELNLDREYTGYGTYRILGNNLTVTNIRNYNYSFLPGILIVNKKLIVITPNETDLIKVYGENDPENFSFTLSAPTAYTGKLSREEGEDAGKYRILIGTLDFGPNYDIILNEAYFTILARIIEVSAENTGKLYGTKDPELLYNYVGTLVGNDKFYGSLVRDAGESVGDYEIMQGSLTINSNYQIVYTPGVFSIRYSEFTDIYIFSTTNNQYQVKGEEEEVKLYARFNEGADESDIGNVVWKIIKNDELEWEFTKDNINNIVSFFPSGSIGTYVVSASYGGKTAYYEVYVEISTVGNVYIRHVNGEVEQTLGKESRLTYMVIVPDTASSDATVQWIINGTTVQANKVSNIYFDYVPNLGKGQYTVQAKIGNKTSDPLYFYVYNNNPPVISLIGEPIIYIEAKTGVDYIEQGATVTDDIDGDISSSLVISGYVNEDVIGTYYIKYDAKDRHGNNAISIYRQVVVRDTTPPVITLKGNREIKLLYGQQYVEYGATAVDNYDGEVEVEIHNPIVIDRIGTYEVTYVAYDNSRNRGTATRYVEIIDNVSPVISLIGDEIMYVEVYSEFVDPGALIEDNVDGTFIMPGTSFFYGDEEVAGIDTSKLGTYYVHYDYQDTAGNIGAGKVRIVIVRDSTAPVITLNGTNPYIIRYSYPDINYNEPGAVAKDNYDEYVPVTISGQLGSELGAYYLYYNAVDSHGNIAKTVTREVIIIDVENPIIYFDRCPQYITLEALYDEYDKRCDAPGWGIYVEDDYKADLEELQKRVVVTGTVDTTTIGTYVIRYDVSDMAGNAAITVNRYVEVVDTTAPTITLLCEDGERCGGDTSQIVEVHTMYEEWGAYVYDRYDIYHSEPINLVISNNIKVTQLGTYEVTYTATDSNGNKSEPVKRIVYVKDTTPPVITIRGENPVIVERGTPYKEDEVPVSVVDNYDGTMDYKKVTATGVPSGMSLGTYEIVYRIMDSSGNIGEAIRTVIVQDTEDPVVLGVEDGKYYKEAVSIYLVKKAGTDEVLTGWLNGELMVNNPQFVDEEGTYDLYVVDDAGNDVSIRFYIDNTPPLIIGVKNEEYTNREVVKISSNEQIKYYEYRYNNGEWVRTTEQEISFSAEGTYRIYAVDMADNVCDVVRFYIDRTPPAYELEGVINKGITSSDVRLNTEVNATIAVNATYDIPTLYTFVDTGYYQIVIRDLAGNEVRLQFVINKSQEIVVDNKLIRFISQHNAINKVSITGKNYARNNGVLIAMPLLEGGFKYVDGNLFSESQYQTLLSGGTIEVAVAGTDDTYMFVGFVVTSEELNKFGSQTVDGDDEDEKRGYIAVALLLLALILFLFIFFLRRRRKEEEEEEEEETIVDEF